MDEKLIVENIKLVKILARKAFNRMGQSIELEELESFGILGLIDASEKFDKNMGVKFETYASTRINGSIYDEVRRLDWVSRSVRDFEKKLNKFKTKFRNDHNRDATAEECAKALGVTESKIYDFESMMVRQNVSSVEELIDTPDGTFDIADMAQKNPEELYITEQYIPNMLKEALEALTERERLVITLLYYEDMTAREVAETIEVSESRVSQLHNNALKKMKTAIPDGAELLKLF